MDSFTVYNDVYSCSVLYCNDKTRKNEPKAHFYNVGNGCKLYNDVLYSGDFAL